MSIILVFSGVFLCFFGLLGLALVIYFGFQSRKEYKKEHKENKKEIFKQLIVINYLSLCLSAFGLIFVALGILLS